MRISEFLSQVTSPTAGVPSDGGFLVPFDLQHEMLGAVLNPARFKRRRRIRRIRLEEIRPWNLHPVRRS